MTIKLLKRPPDGVTLYIDGRLDANTAPSAMESFLKVAEQYREVTLDFGALTYISSAGLRSLLALQKRVSRNGGTLTLTHIRPAVAEVFEMTGFSGILNIE